MKKSELRQVIRQTLKENSHLLEVDIMSDLMRKIIGYVSGNKSQPICGCPDGKAYINCGEDCGGGCCDHNMMGKPIDPLSPPGSPGPTIPPVPGSDIVGSSKPMDPPYGGGTGPTFPEPKFPRIGEADEGGCPCYDIDGNVTSLSSPECCKMGRPPATRKASGPEKGCDCYDSDGNITGSSPECCKMGFRDGMREAKYGCPCSPPSPPDSPAVADRTMVYSPKCCGMPHNRPSAQIATTTTGRGISRGMRETQQVPNTAQQSSMPIKKRGPQGRGVRK